MDSDDQENRATNMLYQCAVGKIEILQILLTRCVSNGYTTGMKDSGLRIRVERQLREKFLELCREQDRPASQAFAARPSRAFSGEWFLVPVFVIDEMIEKIKEGTISDYRYDPNTASLVEAD